VTSYLGDNWRKHNNPKLKETRKKEEISRRRFRHKHQMKKGHMETTECRRVRWEGERGSHQQARNWVKGKGATCQRGALKGGKEEGLYQREEFGAGNLIKKGGELRAAMLRPTGRQKTTWGWGRG